MKYFGIILAIFMMGIVLISGCVTTKAIKDIKSDEYVGKQVSVYGTVEGTIKIGSLSGYTIKDKTDSIAIYSANLPEEGKSVRVKGTLKEIPLLGYYIEEEN